MSDSPATSETTATIDAGTIDWGDTSFQPEERTYDSDGLRMFRMSHNWPNSPLDNRKFQLGGKERVALLEETVTVFHGHRFSKQWMGSGTNGVRRCTLETLGRCLACEHWEAAPDKDGKKHGAARCGRRQQVFVTNLLVYKTDLEGNLIDDQGRQIVLGDQGPALADGTPAELSYEVYVWRFSADKYVQIKQIKQEWETLVKNDLSFILAPGKQENFQDFAVTIMPKAAWRELARRDREAAAAVVEYYKNHKFNIEAIFLKEPSHEDMQGFLTPRPDSPGQMPPTEDIAAEIEKTLGNLDAAVNPVPPPTPEPAAPEATAMDVSPAPAPTTTDDFDELLKS